MLGFDLYGGKINGDVEGRQQGEYRAIRLRNLPPEDGMAEFCTRHDSGTS